VQDAFGYVLFGVVICGTLAAALSFFGRAKLYEQIGRGGLSINEDMGDGPRRSGGGGAIDLGERDEEIRQMLRARNARRAETGGEVVDVEEELARLVAPTIDAALREEIRELVVARNHRRMARGKEPLDVDAEVERQISELGRPL
jgi:hypothetical protein